jgi:RimJ/RimL family protein N-acetyltransferase
MDEAPILNVVGEKVALGPLRRDLIPTYTAGSTTSRRCARSRAPPLPRTEEHEVKLVRGRRRRRRSRFHIYDRAGERPIGTCDLRDVDVANRVATMGLLIGEPSARGGGSVPRRPRCCSTSPSPCSACTASG